MTKKMAVKFSTRWVRIVKIKHMVNSEQEGGKIKINKYPKESLGWGNKKIFSSHCTNGHFGLYLVGMGQCVFP